MYNAMVTELQQMIQINRDQEDGHYHQMVEYWKFTYNPDERSCKAKFECFHHTIPDYFKDVAIKIAESYYNTFMDWISKKVQEISDDFRKEGNGATEIYLPNTFIDRTKYLPKFIFPIKHATYRYYCNGVEIKLYNGKDLRAEDSAKKIFRNYTNDFVWDWNAEKLKINTTSEDVLKTLTYKSTILTNFDYYIICKFIENHSKLRQEKIREQMETCKHESIYEERNSFPYGDTIYRCGDCGLGHLDKEFFKKEIHVNSN